MTLKQKIQTNYLFRFSALLLVLFTFLNGYSQNGVAINTTGHASDISAILDLHDYNTTLINKGFLLPQVTATGNVNTPATGLVVYQTNAPVGIYCNIGTSASPNWIQLSSSSGNGNYILNQTTQQPLSNFNISNAGIIGTTLNVGGLSTLTGITNSGAVTSSGGAINLNSPTSGSSAFATNINTGTNTGTVTIGGTGAQTISIGNGFTTGTNTVNIGSNGDGSNTTSIFGAAGVNINNVSSNGRITTIGGSGTNLTIGVGTSAGTGGTVGLGSSATTTNVNGTPVNINTTNANAVNIGSSINGQTINVGANLKGGTVNIGNANGDAGATQVIIKSGATSPGAVYINAATGIASSTNINTGNTTGAVNIGGSSANVNLSKFTTNGTIFYTSGGIGTLTGLVPGSNNQVLTLSGGLPVWSSIPSGSGDYIQNQSASSQNAKYWINGPANIGGVTFNAANQLDVASSGANNNAIVATNAAASGTGGGDGVDGFTNQSAGAGLWAANTNASGTGIMGGGNNQTTYYLIAGSGGAFTGNTTGVFAKNTTTGTGEAIYTERGDLSNPTVVRINYYNGTQYKIIGSGTPSTIALSADNNSKITLHCPEAPEILFEDYGEGKLVDGRAHVNIDPIFSKNVAINDKHPLRVFVQLEGDCNGVYVTKKSKNGFDVIELQKGSSNVSFQWHIVCNRANEDLGNGKISHNEDMRFEKAPSDMQSLNSLKVVQKIKSK